MKVAIGSDNLGYKLKQTIINEFSRKGYEFFDFGCFDEEPIDYPDVAQKLANAVSNHEFERGILICGTGIGMQIVANKTKGVYAAVCHDVYSTKRSILSNDINVMCLGAIVIGVATAIELVQEWLELEFINSPSLKKINKIKEIESGYLVKGD